MRTQGTAEETGLGILIVEDETLFAMDLEILLEDMGHHIVGVASHVDRALQMIGKKQAKIDCALVDPVLGLRSSRPVAEALSAARIPLIGIATEAGAEKLLPQDVPSVSKPCSLVSMQNALRNALPRVVA